MKERVRAEEDAIEKPGFLLSLTGLSAQTVFTKCWKKGNLVLPLSICVLPKAAYLCLFSPNQPCSAPSVLLSVMWG